LFDGSRKNVISLLPGDSSDADGIKYQLYKSRFAALTGLASEDVEAVMPSSHEYWIYYPNAGSDWEGFQGYIKTSEEVDKLARILSATKAGAQQNPSL
jgi:hypothetical protein